MSYGREPRRWSRLDAVFHGAAALPDAERAAYLERACGDDPAFAPKWPRCWRPTRPTTRSASSVASTTPGPMPRRRSVRRHAARALAHRRADRLRRHGSRVPGGTRRRTVRATGRVENRAWTCRPTADPRAFRAERHILARVSHPNIARLLDAGCDTRRLRLARHGVRGRRAHHDLLRRAPADGSRNDCGSFAASRAPRSTRTSRSSFTATQAGQYPGFAHRRGEAARLRHRQAARARRGRRDPTATSFAR